MAILIKGGRVLDPATKTDEITDILLNEEGTIEKLGKKLKSEKAEVVNAEGCFVMPGFVDLHEHLRDPGQEYKEDILTGAYAAERGGYTTILAMANTIPPVDNPDVVSYVLHKAEECNIHVLTAGTVTKGMKGGRLSDIEGMKAAGISCISEDGKTVMNADLYRRAMKTAVKLDLPIMSHCEDHNLAFGGVMNEDERAKELGLPGISNSTEDVITIRDLMLARDTGVRLHLCHVSTRDAVWLIQTAKKWGVHVTAEATPHHFTLTSEDVDPENASFKMNPPLRTAADREAVREGLKSGVIDCIATDHAPHSFEDKNESFIEAPFGVIGSETAAAITYTELVLGGYLTPLQMAEKMSYNPAKILGLDAGELAPGKPADICVFDPKKTYRINKELLRSKSRNTPFHGREVKGDVVCTICGGKIVYQRGKNL